MNNNKKMAVLVAVALILAITAITLNIMDSEVPVVRDAGLENAANIGVDIIPTPVEDKLGESSQGEIQS